MGINVGINLRQLYSGKIGGMEVYIRNLIKYLLKVDYENDYILLLNEENFDTFIYDSERVKKFIVPHNGYEEVIKRLLSDYKASLYFCPLLVLEPLLVDIPCIVNIPDLQHEYYPEFFSKEVLEWRISNFKRSADIADVVITLSSFSRRTIIEKLSIDENKVHYVHLAADDIYSCAVDTDASKKIRVKYDLPDYFGFYPANTWPHKNHVNLIKSLAIFKEKYGEPPKLVFTGYSPEGLDFLIKEIDKYDLRKQVMFLGYIDKKDMPYIYNNASFLVLPSYFEGFGIPILEAMKMNCPVLCSNNTSITEVSGDAAMYFDPFNPEDIADKINRLLQDESLRKLLISKGKEQAKKFSWENTAIQTLSLFKQAAEITPPKRKGRYPLVSIITPSYNQGEFIEETILSVLNQDYPNIEYIIIDGGSTDNTLDIIKKYGNKVKWISEKDKGQADAVNKGFTMAQGKILGWLNSDDTYLPGTIRKVVDYLLENQDTVMVYGNAYWIDRDGNIISPYPTEPFNNKRLSETCFICQPSVFLRSEVVKEVGQLDASLNTCMDYEYWIRINKRFPSGIRYMPQYIANSRMYDQNKTISRREEVYEEIINTVKKYYGIVADSWVNGYINEIVLNKYLARYKKNSLVLRGIFYLIHIMINPGGINRTTHLKLLGKKVLTMFKQILSSYFYNEIYADGWVSKQCVVNLRNEGKTGLISITGLHSWPYDDPLVLKIYCKKRLVLKKVIHEKGQFIVEFNLPTDILNENEIRLVIKANKTFVPLKHRINNDRRNLSFILRRVEIC